MADPYATASAVDAYLGAESDNLGAQARASMNNSVGKDSAFEADLRGVAQRTGVPVDTVRSYPQEMKQQDAMRVYDFNQLAREYPNASRFLANEDNAAVAHKDVGLLKSIESGVGSLLSYAMGNGPGDGFIGTMRAAPYTAAAGFSGVKRAAVDVVEPWASFITQDKDNLFARSSAQYGAQASAFSARAKEINPASGGLVADGVRSGVDSLLQNSKYMAFALLPGGQPYALAGFGMEAFGASYNKAADKNVPLIPRITYAASDGVIEFGTERGPMGALVQNIKAGTPLFLAIVRNAWRENKGEQVATALQDLNEWAVIQPVGTPFTDYVKERPAAAVQTLIATLVGSAGNTVITRGMQGAADVAQGRDRQAEYAVNAHGLLTEMQKTVEASEIIKHSSGTLNAYMQGLVEDSGIENVYLDSAKLVAAGVDLQALAQELPSVASQLDQVQSGGDLVIPTAELLSLSSAYGQPLMDHARTDPNGMSRSEAQTYMQEKGDTLNAEIDRVLAEQDNDQEFKAGRDQVQAEILTQLNEVKRFTAQVNTQYATLAANFYAVMAARSGMTVTQFSQTYQLGFSGQTAAGQQVLGQPGASTQDVVIAIENKYPDLKLDVGGSDNTISVSRIVLPQDSRGQGIGTQVMQELAAHADATGKTLTLSPSKDFGGSVPRLKSFYKSLGFVENKGKNKDLSISDTMYRKPQAVVATNFDGTNPSILQQDQRGQIAFANDITQQASIISLFKAADLSTFIHEGGHFFLEVQADLATRITTRIARGETVSDGERSILDDMNKTLDWMGVKGSPEMSAIDTWYLMSNDEKRPHHEQWARGFEAYAFEGKSPSIELTTMFQTFRSWLVNVYRSVLNSVNAGPADIANAMNVELSDEVRAVMDRMLATSDKIQEAEAAREMGSLFASAESAGMDLEAYKAYHDMGTKATMDAVDELQAKGLRDMQWLSRARSRALKDLQKQHDALRAQVAREVRAEVMSQPVYRLWTFLTARAGDQLAGNKPVGQARGVNPEVDNIFTAIAKMGGLDRDEVASQWGLTEREKLESGVFGAPVVRAKNGVSMDMMAENLVDEGYIIEGRKGMSNLEQLEALFDDQRSGVDRYSLKRDMEAAYGEQPLDVPELPAMGFGKLRTQDLRDTYGTADDAIWRKLSELRMTSDTTGLHPDVVAELFEFTSADHMVSALLAAEPPISAVEGRTDQRMLEESGDLATPAGLERAANIAVLNENRMRVVATELRAIQHAMAVRAKVPGQKNTVDVLARAAKEYATEIIARLKVRDIRPAQYTAAEVRASKAAQKATGDLAEQAMQKRNQLINMYAAKAAYTAQDEVKAAILYFRKFDKASKTLDPEYRSQIEAMLERFDLRASTSLKEIAKRKTLVEWMDAQAKLGLEPDIPSDLLDEANRKSFKDMTVEEVRGLRETIQQIEHLGRLKHRLMTAQDKRDFDVIVAEAGESIRANGGEMRAVELEEPRGVLPWLDGFTAGHRKLASLFRQMDGNVDAGPLWRILGRGMNASGTSEAVMIEAATVRLTEMYAPLLKLKGGVHGDKRYIPEIDASLTRGARLSVALNWGNDTNRARIVAGDNWSETQVMAILRTLSPVELNFVNETWAYINTFWPQIADKQKRVTGVAPDKVEASPFALTASDGTTVNMAGGYYPIKYDANRDDRAEKLDAAALATDMLRGAMTRSTTRRGHTKARVEDVKRPVKKTLDVITQHVAEVVHDLSWHEWLIDANRLLDAKPINQAIRSHYGTATLRTMKDGLQSIASADMIPQTKMDQALLHLRGNISRSIMGLSLTTAFLQPFGLAQSVVRIGPTHVLRGLARWGGDAARFENSNTWISEKSDFMRLRSTTFNRELREIRGRISQGHSRARQVYDASLFILMQKMQMVADVPTWIGAYEKALASGQDEATAVALADQGVVDSQGGGQTQDMAEVQRRHPMLSMFYSYFNTTYNLAAESTGQTNFKNPLSIAGWLADMMMLMVIPAIGPALILDLLRSGGGDDDDAEAWAKKLAEWQAGYLLGTMIGLREASGLVAGYDYAGPPVGRVVSDLGKTAVQVGQGEADEALVLASIRLMGSATGIPTVQILRSYRGWQAWGNDEAPATAMLLGPPPRD